MKKFVFSVLTVLLVFALAACGNDGDKDSESKVSASSDSSSEKIKTDISSPVEIDFWHAMSGNHEIALQKITDDFNSSQEDITVKLVNQGSYDDLNTKNMAAAKAGNLPALTQAYEDWMTNYIDHDLITDLTPYVTSDEVGLSKEEVDDIVQIFREANTWDGKYYGMPFNKSTQIMYYNVDYFEEAGLNAPTTWDELRDAAEKLTTEKDGRKIVGLGLENSTSSQINQWVLQAGGNYLDEDSGKFLMNSPEGKEALEFLNGMFKDGSARLAGEDGYMSEPFARGDAAIYFGSSAGIPYVAAPAKENGVNWAAAPLPKGKQAATAFAGTNVAIFSSATDDEKLAAWEFIKFLINADNTTYWAMETGYLPVRYSALEKKEWVTFTTDHPEYGVGEKQFDAGFYDPRLAGAYELKNAVAKVIDKVFLGELTEDEGLKSAEEAANKSLKK
ncbi:ABC transporter substrate-binding protein [Sporosarcina sp. BI001-red]|uniref:ABC transporter substrate-binding protein n=1 Tax=Sporosarcina sp. BI001-red TaxID=2282866 RepID=UPI000E21D480|nr:ABC transporter substrate-binding protein [Sporosarcina sp. BI001-red]REB11022.1 ABC transporter substrate-binding protein [Sporosarcina sp. BI001-red]